MLEKIFPSLVEARARREARIARHEAARARARFDLRALHEAEASLARYSGWRTKTEERILGNWDPGGEPGTNLTQDLTTLQRRTADVIQNSPYAAGIAQKFRIAVVSQGMHVQSEINPEDLGLTEDQATAVQDAAEALFDRWARPAGAGVLESFYLQQGTALMSLFSAGEALSVLTSRRSANPYTPFRTWSKLLEPTRLRTPSDLADKSNVQHGVEFDVDGLPVAYWVKKAGRDPGQAYDPAPDTRQHFQRIPVRDEFGRLQVIHVFDPEWVGQKRGRPRLSLALGKLKYIDMHDEAAHVSKWMRSCIGLIFQTPPGRTPIGREMKKNKDGEVAADASTGRHLVNYHPGMSVDTLPGETVQTLDWRTDSDDFIAFQGHQKSSVGAIFPIPDEVLFGKYGGATYSSARAMVLDAIKVWEAYANLMAYFNRPHYERVFEEAVLLRLLPVVSTDFYARYQLWTASSWGHPGYHLIDPVKEIEALVLAIEHNLMTHQQATQHLGRDHLQIFRQRKREIAKQREMDILPETIRKAQDTPEGRMALLKVLVDALTCEHLEAAAREPLIVRPHAGTNGHSH